MQKISTQFPIPAHMASRYKILFLCLCVPSHSRKNQYFALARERKSEKETGSSEDQD